MCQLVTRIRVMNKLNKSTRKNYCPHNNNAAAVCTLKTHGTLL